MFNTSRFIIRSLQQRSNISKQCFINNKKVYNLSIYKNRQKGYNHLITKKIHTTSTNNPLYGSRENNNGPNLPIIIIIMITITSFMGVSSNIKK